MSQSAKTPVSQAESGPPARRGKAAAAGADALGHAHTALARAGFRDATLILRWGEIVGAAVARTAQPVRYQSGPEGGVLTLKCEAGAMVFLQHQTRMVLDAVNAYAGGERVVRIKLVAGKLGLRAEPPSRAPSGFQPPAESGGKPARPTLCDALERLSQLRQRAPRR